MKTPTKIDMETYKIITVLGRSPGWINAIPEELQDWYGAMHEDYLSDMKELEKEWYEGARRKDWLAQWKGEVLDFSTNARIRYLKQRIMELNEINRENALMAIAITKEHPLEVSKVVVPILAQSAEKTQKLIEKHSRELEIRKVGAVEEIPMEMIYRAKEYPIEQIVTVGRSGRAKCVFHDGEDENMDIRKNYAFCYVCGRSGDAIDVYRQVYDVNFKQAVLALQ